MAAYAYGQTQQQVRNRIEGTERPDVTKQLSSSKKGSSSDSSNPSDSGAQRPVILKKAVFLRFLATTLNTSIAPIP